MDDVTLPWLRARGPSASCTSTVPVPGFALTLGTTTQLHLLSPSDPRPLRFLAAAAGGAPGIQLGSHFVGPLDDIFFLSIEPNNGYFLDFGAGLLGAHGADEAAIATPNLAALVDRLLNAAYLALVRAQSPEMGGILSSNRP